MLATRLLWRLEYQKQCDPTHIGCRANLGTEDGLAILGDEVLHVSRHSHLVRTVLATDIANAYDNIQPEIILRNMETLGLPKQVARRLVRFVLQPRLVYQAQFQRLTSQQWARLKVVNRDAIRAATTLPRLTPIPTLQEHAQLNTLTELVNQHEQARILKNKHIPWCYTNISTNRTTKLRRSAQPAPTPETSIPQGQCVVYMDAAILPRGGRVAF
ncbi:hypothetical protein HPB47_007123, partial [Ixodes persulcatus]